MPTTTDPVSTAAERWSSTDLDEWTRYVVRRHFDPEKGSLYWLKRQPELPFDPLDITRYEELAAFGNLDLATLRHLDPVDLVPQGIPRPLAGRVWESGGTTGRPCRVFYTGQMIDHHARWRIRQLRTAGFEPGRTWLYAAPSGPHLVGRGADQIAEHYRSTVYTIDLDPRWIKRLILGSQLAEINAYVDHVVEQIVEVLETCEVDYLETTPALLQALLGRRPHLVARLAGVGLGGTPLHADMYQDFVAALDGGVIGLTYGNTFGSAMGLPVEADGGLVPYLPGYPHVTMAVVDREFPNRVVGYGESGQVRLTVLHEDLFLPNILEHDQALRYRTGAEWPCDGVANVIPSNPARAVPTSLY